MTATLDNLDTHTAASLAGIYNGLSGKNIKPSSYSKAKLIEMIKALAEKVAKEEPTEDEGFEGFTHCPHCGIHHGNGFATNQDLLDQGSEGNKTHHIVCLACLGEFGEKLETTFTMAEAAAAAGVSPKVARARYRNVHNDHQRTFYVFPRSQWDAVQSIISPKRKGR